MWPASTPHDREAIPAPSPTTRHSPRLELAITARNGSHAAMCVATRSTIARLITTVTFVPIERNMRFVPDYTCDEGEGLLNDERSKITT
jgi:hypothetical protein